jgi:hypothetical protein
MSTFQAVPDIFMHTNAHYKMPVTSWCSAAVYSTHVLQLLSVKHRSSKLCTQRIYAMPTGLLHTSTLSPSLLHHRYTTTLHKKRFTNSAKSYVVAPNTYIGSDQRPAAAPLTHMCTDTSPQMLPLPHVIKHCCYILQPLDSKLRTMIMLQCCKLRIMIT